VKQYKSRKAGEDQSNLKPRSENNEDRREGKGETPRPRWRSQEEMEARERVRRM